MSDGPNPANDRVEVWPHTDAQGRDVWDWRRLDVDTGDVLSNSAGQGYVDREYALRAAKAYNVGVQRFDVLDHDPNAQPEDHA